MLQALFPDNTYGVDSGGDPTVIPKLTFDEFKVCCVHQEEYFSSLSEYYIKLKCNCLRVVVVVYIS